MFKLKINLDRHGRRILPNICLLPGPRCFSFPSTFNPLRYGGGLIGPPFFQRPNSQKNLKCQKSEKITIPLLRSVLCTLCSNFYQNHLVCLQNAFENNNPNSVADPDPGSGAFLNPGSGIGFFRIPDPKPIF